MCICIYIYIYIYTYTYHFCVVTSILSKAGLGSTDSIPTWFRAILHLSLSIHKYINKYVYVYIYIYIHIYMYIKLTMTMILMINIYMCT